MRQVAHKFTRAGDSFDVVLEDAVGHTGDLGVHLGTSELFFGHGFVSYSLYDFGSRNKHIARILNHKYEIC